MMHAPWWASATASTWQNWLRATPGEYAVHIGRELWDDVQNGNSADTVTRIVPW